MIQSTALAHMTIPEKAILANKTQELVKNKKREYSSQPSRSFTPIIAMNTAFIFGTPLAVAASIIFPSFMFLNGYGIAITVISYIGLFICGLGTPIEVDRTKELFAHIKDQRTPVALNPWDYQSGVPDPNVQVDRYNRYLHDDKRKSEVISLKTRTSTIWTYVNPLRLFKKVLLSETISYSLYEDVYTRTRHYLGAVRYTVVTENFQGSRKSFQKALSAIESGK